MTPPPADHPFTPDLFAREDETDDRRFYAEPRKVVHLDAAAIAAVTKLFAEVLPADGEILDLMSSWRSHLPPPAGARRVVGLGLNAEEMAENPDLHERVVHDVNAEPRLPFADARFAAATLSLSLQYLTQPIDLFRDVARVLVPGAPFVVVLSNRCFPSKAVAIWKRCETMRERMELAMAYFQYSAAFADVVGIDLRPAAAPGEDPAVAVVGRRPGDPAPGVRRASWRRRR